VMESRKIADPLKLLEVVMPCFGGGGVIVTTRERARRTPHRPALLTGYAERLTHKSVTYAPDLIDTPIRHASDRAFKMAGAKREAVDYAGMYDCFTITVLITIEDAGFCKKGQGGAFIDERDLRFEVNPTAYLDTGLFLDHRDTRRMVRERAAGKRFLNLFAYTGSFTVYAAAGGAKHSITVDMSNTYQAWSKRNLALNGLDDPGRHDFVQSDVVGFLERMHGQGEQFDLIVLDPPSFSNSKRMGGTFDVQRDQLALLSATLRLLTPGGELFFSNNRQGFRLDAGVGKLASVAEITRQTVPVDFKRQTPHRCWLLKKP